MKQRTNKKLYSIMAGLLIAAPLAVHADSGSTVVYGQARLSVDYVDNDEDSTEQVANNDSRFGIKGFEDLGNSIRVIFQFEAQADLDDGGADGTTGTFFSTGRSSYVGLATDYGTVALGIHDSPHRESTDKIDIFGNSLADHNTIIGNVGDGDTTAEFNRREPNTINYWSPRYNGFQFKGQVRVDEDPEVSETRYSVGGFYENGPVYAAIAYEVHGDEGGDDNEDTDGLKLGAAYAFNEEKTRVGFIYDRISEDGGDSIFDRNAYYVNLSHKLDNNVFKIGYALADDSDAEGDDGADFYFIGLSHNLSKRTEIYGLYAAVNNDEDGAFGLGNSTNGATPIPEDVDGDGITGSDIKGVSLGIIHKF